MESPIYNIMPNAGGGLTGYGLHNTSPSWLIAFYPYDISTIGLNNNTNLKSTAPIIVMSDAISVSVSGTKRSMRKAASISLKLGEMDYSKALHNGDHVMIWMANFQEDINKVHANIASGRGANDFMSGLKFVGKISTINNTVAVSDNGTPSYLVDITAESFGELDLSVYVTKYASSVVGASGSENQVNPGVNKDIEFFTRLSPDLWRSFNESNNRVWKTPDEIVKFLLSIFLGAGPTDAIKSGDSKNNPNRRGTFNNVLLYPAGVSAALSGPISNPNYLDILRITTGVESYTGGDVSTNTNLLLPNSAPQTGGIRSGVQLKGASYLHTPSWENIPLSQIVNQWINPISNELYSSLRWVGEEGIRPVITHRQIPLSTQLVDKYMAQVKAAIITDDIANLPKGYSTIVTKFKNLPRWRIAESLVNSINIGASNAGHINFVQVFPSGLLQDFLKSNSNDGSSNSPVTVDDLIKTIALEKGNFISDDNDIKKHGLHAAIMEASMDIPQLKDGSLQFLSPFWTAMQADFQMNSHLKFTGRISAVGIQEPIAEGDNLEFSGVLYHIEGIEHKARISPNGNKEFVTQFTLSNGIISASLVDESQDPIYPGAVGGYTPQFGKTNVQLTQASNNSAAASNPISNISATLSKLGNIL